MGIGAIVDSVVNKVKSFVSPDAPPPAPPSPAAPVVPVQYKDGFEANNATGVDTAKAGIAKATAPMLAKIDEHLTDSALKNADDLMKAGKYDEARAAVAPLKNPPLSDVKTNPWKEFKNESVHSDAGFDKSTTFKNPAEFEETVGTEADRKLAQIDQAQKMSKVLNKTVDPTNVNDVKKYFDAISDKDAKPKLTTKQIGDEFGKYTQNFYQHTGGLTWSSKDAVADRVKPGTLNDMLHSTPPHPHDTTGRAALDCEGHTYLAAAVFQNNPRFDVTFASGGSHISATVFEKNSAEKGFTVNTLHSPVVRDLVVENGPQLNKTFKSVEDRQGAVAKGRHGQLKPDGTYQGQAQTASRDINKANGTPAD
jgi:hypothetical protein